MLSACRPATFSSAASAALTSSSRLNGFPSKAFTATAPATAEAALPPWPPESGRPFRTVSAIPRSRCVRVAYPIQDCSGSERRGVTGRIAGEIVMPRFANLDARRPTPLGPYRIALAGESEPEDIEPGADIAHPARGERGDTLLRRPHAPASRRMSFSTPAAVTSAPAPGPGDHQRIGFVSRGGEDQLIVGALDGGERAGRRHRRALRPRFSPGSPGPHSAAPLPAAAAVSIRRFHAGSISSSRSRNSFSEMERAHWGTSDSTALRRSSPG